MRVADLELDLDVFAGPFDLLLTLVLREEVDLLEVDLAEVVVAYLDHLERAGELDLEAATEFLVLIAALLELKSRLMLPGEDDEGLAFEPGEAAEELLARLLESHRYRGASAWLTQRLETEGAHRFRSAPLPPDLRRARLEEAPTGVYDPERLGEALGDLLRMPRAIDVGHLSDVRISVAERLAHLRALLRRGSFAFEDAVARADRMTVAVTLFALLELYKRGEATWEQDEPFSPITVAAAPARAPARSTVA
jgi:segregation and condensation protein A